MSKTMRSLGVALGAFSLVVGSVATLAHFRGMSRAHASVADEGANDPLAMKVAPVETAPPQRTAPFAGLDLSKITVGENGATATLPNKRIAALTIDARLQRAAVASMKQHKLPEATIVMMDPDTGAILAYASRMGNDRARDLAIEATAPSASVFKIVTATALVEKDGATPQTRECFARSAEQRVNAADLVVDPLRDKWCMTLATAMGKSENAVFARMAHEHLDRASLENAAHALGYGAPLAFDVPVQPSKLEVPDDALGFARTAAGFWNTTLSPLHAAELSAIIARNGEAIRPHVVARITDDGGHVEYEAARDTETHRAISPTAADALTTMMEHTITEGTSYRAFHDAHRTAFVPASVAGKTGTLSGGEGEHGAEPRLYSWFTGFAPSHAQPGQKRIAIAVLVVNKPKWHVKANVIAREMLREFFHEDAPRVAQR
jgi:cell division protein FtsI/penicillin-binding protein 2